MICTFYLLFLTAKVSNRNIEINKNLLVYLKKDKLQDLIQLNHDDNNEDYGDDDDDDQRITLH